jgi:uncharacterized RDD family membrane protein YckC
MERQSYRIILEGTIKEGLERTVVVQTLSHVFGRDTGTVEKLLAGRPRLIRTQLDLETASKYRTIIERAGALCRIEPDPASVEIPEPAAPEPTAPAPSDEKGITCPRCGYRPSRSDDVLIVRGDCPRCGLLVQKTDQILRTEGQQVPALESKDEPPNIYGERVPASWLRRGLAATYSLGAFLLVYWCIVLAFMVVFFPLETIPSLIARDFVPIAVANFPLVLSSASIFLVMFAYPLFKDGSTPGQQAFGIRMLFLGEGNITALMLALALRTLAAGTVSFVPGLLFQRAWRMVFTPVERPLMAMVVTAGLAWAALAAHAHRTPDKRSALDIVAGSIQTEESIMPPNPWKKALTPLAGALGFLIVVGFILPYVAGE